MPELRPIVTQLWIGPLMMRPAAKLQSLVVTSPPMGLGRCQRHAALQYSPKRLQAEPHLVAALCPETALLDGGASP